MDPFIEGCGLWEDFHGHLIEKISEVFTDTLPPSYLVKTGERSYVVLADAEGDTTHPFKPDVTVTGEARSVQAATAVVGSAVKTAPFSVRAFIEEEFRERFVEIHEGDGEDRLVTRIEVLSPANKKPNFTGWDQYQRKRQGMFLGHSANLIEIDLVRGGRRMPMVDSLPTSPYMILVSRKEEMPYCQVWDAHFDRPCRQFLCRFPGPIPMRRSICSR